MKIDVTISREEVERAVRQYVRREIIETPDGYMVTSVSGLPYGSSIVTIGPIPQAEEKADGE